MKCTALCLALCVSASANVLTAQPLVQPMPPASMIRVDTGLVFHQWSDTTLRFDLYRPRSGANLPVLIIYNGFASPGIRQREQQVGWSKLAAAAGIAAVGYDSHPGGESADFDSVTAYLRKHASEYGIDASRQIFFAWSGHVSRGLGVAMDTTRRDIRAAVFYYGVGRVAELRMDLPTLFVRAGLDNPSLNQALDDVIRRGLTSNAPISVINYGSGLHGFDGLNDNALTRQIIAQTLAFMTANVEPAIRGTLDSDAGVARAAASLARRDWATAVPAYERLVAANPQSSEMNLRLGQSLLGAGEYRRALVHLQRAWDLSNGGRARDIGIPAATAASKLGDFTAAEPWLRILMTRGFTTQQIAADTNFAGLRGNPGFEAFIRSARP